MTGPSGFLDRAIVYTSLRVAPCNYLLHHATTNPPQPAEYCDADAEDEYEYCIDHLGISCDEDPDDARDLQVDQELADLDREAS